MKVSFTLNDEKTVTNTTVKIIVAISGTINGESRKDIEARCDEIAKKIFPDVKWAFSNFKYNGDGLTFTVSASTRIDATQNDQLASKCAEASNDSTRIAIQTIDASIPTHDIRTAESDIRINLIKLADEEAKRLGGKVQKVLFNPSYTDNYSNSRGGGRMMLETAGASYAADNSGSQLGHSEKIVISAEVSVKIDKRAAD